MGLFELSRSLFGIGWTWVFQRPRSALSAAEVLCCYQTGNTVVSCRGGHSYLWRVSLDLFMVAITRFRKRVSVKLSFLRSLPMLCLFGSISCISELSRITVARLVVAQSVEMPGYRVQSESRLMDRVAPR